MIERRAEIDRELAEKEQFLTDTEEFIRITSEKLTAHRVTLQAVRERISALSEKLSYKNAREALNEKNKAEAEKQILEKKIAKADQDVTEQKTAIAELKAKIEEAKKHLENAEDIDIDAERTEYDVIKARKGRADLRIKDIHARITANATADKSIREHSEEIRRVDERLTWVRALYNTASGKVSGKDKTTLEAYIQAAYFDRIIDRANTRLLIMSGGQYMLMRSDKSEDKRIQSGLELDVKDYYNGTVRSVKTLSGGESFKASLALALGLSEEIQSSAGGIKLDTMFVDEGFGSLDEESLEQAKTALMSLGENDRLVGIISHVRELKDSIAKQIIVTKDRSGGSSVKIVY